MASDGLGGEARCGVTGGGGAEDMMHTPKMDPKAQSDWLGGWDNVWDNLWPFPKTEGF